MWGFGTEEETAPDADFLQIVYIRSVLPDAKPVISQVN